MRIQRNPRTNFPPGCIPKKWRVFRNLKTTRKLFFWDLGIRNAVIGNFSPLESRTDSGALWENFIISERMKIKGYDTASFARSYFWRTKDQSEIDYIEEEDGAMKAFEFKWNSSKSWAKCPPSFSTAYPEASFKVITPDNIEEFLL